MKNINPEEKDTLNGYFWVFGGLLCILLISIMAQDIDRPFIGLHSLGHAHDAWVARTHLNYGLGYTKGFNTFAVGHPPAENPSRHLDHPQLFALFDAAAMAVFGVNEWALRTAGIMMAVVSLVIFLKILKALVDHQTAILAALLFAIFPLTGYFGVGRWMFPLSLWAIWCYLVLIRALKDGPEAIRFHKWALAISLFLILQLGWEGFFYALGIGVHYVFRCIRRKQLPDKVLLGILIIVPLSSLALNFVVMAAGRGWDFQRIVELYKWRAGRGEMAEFDWGKWFARFWEFAVMNFTLAVLILAIGYFTLGQLYVFASKDSKGEKTIASRRFPQFWLFLLPGVFQLFLLRGTLWMHHYWERPLAPFIAIAAAQGIFVIADILTKIRPLLAKISTAVLVLIITISCAIGLNYYRNISHFSLAKVKLFKMLNERIPPDKGLLSFESLIFDQHSAKQSSYRQEIAWYLDREIVQARTVSEIEKQAKTGRFPYYLMPGTYYDREMSAYLAKLSNELQQRYKMTYIPPDPGGPGQAPMLPYFIFELSSAPSNK